MKDEASWASTPATRAVMQGNRGRDTQPEKALRASLHRLGLRYRVNYPSPATPRRTIDVAFTRQRVAVFVDGCFWHGCPDHHRPAVTNASFWSAKVSANRSRDHETTKALEAAGWRVLRLWEHEDPDGAARRVEMMVRDLPRFTLDSLEAEAAAMNGRPVQSWEAVRYGQPWNGWATPVVTRAVLESILEAVRRRTGEPHRWEGSVAIVSGPLDSLGVAEHAYRFEPDSHGRYDLGSLGWTWVLVGGSGSAAG